MENKDKVEETTEQTPQEESNGEPSTRTASEVVAITSEDEVVLDKNEEQSEVEALQAKVDKLENMLRATADRGRLEQFESRDRGKKPMRVHLSKFGGGVIVGWRTLKDQLIKHPTTGKTVGEEQEYELLIYKDDGTLDKVVVDGYPAFSDARYGDRIEVEVVNKSEDWDGRMTFTVTLPNGKTYDLAEQFVN